VLHVVDDDVGALVADPRGDRRDVARGGSEPLSDGGEEKVRIAQGRERDEDGAACASSASRRASSRAKRVLPVPPGPTMVRARGSRSYASETASKSSRSRPMKRVGGVGSSTLPGVRRGGKSSEPSW
jgi:hypothetical protein